jgi:carbamate kinase
MGRYQLYVELSENEKRQAYNLAKSKGMTFQGWLGQLIQAELKAEETQERVHHAD